MENRSSSSEEEESSESEEEEEEEVSPSAVREVEHDGSKGLEYLEVKAPQETLEQIRVKSEQLPDTEIEKKVENKAEPQWTKVKEVNRSTPAASPVTPRQSRALTIGESRTAQHTPTEATETRSNAADTPAPGNEERRVEEKEQLEQEKPSRSEPGQPQPNTDQPKAERKEKPSAQDNAPGLGLLDLSEEMIIYLFSFLEPPELGSVALTCRKFRAVRAYSSLLHEAPVDQNISSNRRSKMKSCGSFCCSVPTAPAVCSCPSIFRFLSQVLSHIDSLAN